MGITIQRYAEPGTWSVSVLLRDNTGNSVTIGSAALAAAGLPSTVTVIDGNPDLQGPQLTAISFSPSSVDVSNSSAAVTVALTITDDLSGLAPFSIQPFI